MWPRCFHVLCQEKIQKNNVHVGKSAVISCFRMLSYTQLFWTEKPVTSCSTMLVTLTWSQSHLQKKIKNQLSCIYLRDKCKGFLPFHVSPVNAESPFLISSQCIVHFLVVWMDVSLNCVTFPVYVNCVCACLCVLVNVNTAEWMVGNCALKCLEI